MDECNIEGPFPELRWVGDKDRHVWINEQHDEDTEEDSRSKEPLENLAEAGISQTVSKSRMAYPCDGPRSHDEVCEHQGVTNPFNDHFLRCNG